MNDTASLQRNPVAQGLWRTAQDDHGRAVSAAETAARAVCLAEAQVEDCQGRLGAAERQLRDAGAIAASTPGAAGAVEIAESEVAMRRDELATARSGLTAARRAYDAAAAAKLAADERYMAVRNDIYGTSTPDRVVEVDRAGPPTAA